MNTKRYLISSIALFIFIFASDFVVHHILLMESYRETEHLWRPESDMGAYFPVMLAAQIIMSFLVAYIFTKNYENKGIGEGVRFGLLIGLIWAVMMSSSYAYMPIPVSLAVSWFAAGLIQGIIGGVVLSLTYKN